MGGKRTEGWGVSDWTDVWDRAYHRVAVKVGKDWKVEGSISWWGSGTGMLAVSGCVVERDIWLKIFRAGAVSGDDKFLRIAWNHSYM